MNRFYCFLFTLLSLACAEVEARQVTYESGGDLTPELASFDVTHYDLNVKIDPADSTVSGYVDLYFEMVQPHNRIALALDPLMVLESVEWMAHSKTLTFSRNENHHTFYVHFPVTLQPGTTHQLRIRYGGSPRSAPNPPW